MPMDGDEDYIKILGLAHLTLALSQQEWLKMVSMDGHLRKFKQYRYKQWNISLVRWFSILAIWNV